MLIVFDIDDNIQLPEEVLEDIVTKTPLWSLSTEWRWFDDAHLEHVLIAVPEPTKGITSDDDCESHTDSNGSIDTTDS